MLFALGSLADAAISPTVTLLGPLLVALWLATTATGRIERACLWATAVVLAGLTLGSLADLGEVRDALAARRHGAFARTRRAARRGRYPRALIQARARMTRTARCPSRAT